MRPHAGGKDERDEALIKREHYSNAASRMSRYIATLYGKPKNTLNHIMLEYTHKQRNHLTGGEAQDENPNTQTGRQLLLYDRDG